MNFIDNHSYQNRLRLVDPASKVLFVFIVLILCLVSDSPFVGFTAVLWMWGLAVLLAKIPFRVLGKILMAEFGFFVLATAGVAISVTLKSPVDINPWTLNFGLIWFSTSPELLIAALLILTRVMGGVAAMNFLALTTPMVDIISFLHRVRVPGLLIDITTLMYRFVFALLESLHTIWIAQESRLGYSSGFRRGIISAGHLGSRLFIDAFHRSKRLEISLNSRCYSGELKVLPIEYQSGSKLLVMAFFVVSSLILVWIFL